MQHHQGVNPEAGREASEGLGLSPLGGQCFGIFALAAGTWRSALWTWAGVVEDEGFELGEVRDVFYIPTVHRPNSPAIIVKSNALDSSRLSRNGTNQIDRQRSAFQATWCRMQHLHASRHAIQKAPIKSCRAKRGSKIHRQIR